MILRELGGLRSGWMKYFDNPPPLSPSELERRIENLREQMQQHEGEFVLVVTREWEQADRPGPGQEPREEWDYVKQYLHLGTSTRPFFTRGDCSLIVHTPRHVLVRKGGEENATIKDGAIPDIEIYNLERPLPGKKRFVGRAESPGFALEIIVGDQEVSAWVLKAAEEHRRRGSLDTRVLVTFQRMQKVLGREIPLPESYRKQVETEELKRKMALLGRLEDLTEQEGILRERLAQIQKLRLPRIVLDIEDSSYEREVKQDEKDARIIKSIPILDELKDVQARMRDVLKTALGLGLHEEPCVIIQEPTPGTQITIDVPQLIKNYCEHYEITIPQNSPKA